MEAEGLINHNKSNRTGFRILKGGKDEKDMRNFDQRDSIFDNVSPLDDYEGLHESKSPWYFRTKVATSETFKYDNEKVIMNYGPGFGELKIPDSIQDRDSWRSLRKK